MAREVAEFVAAEPRGRLIEVGAGTGAITEALAKAVDPDRMTIVEADRGCCVYLRRRFPGTHVVEGLIEERLDELVRTGERLALVSSVPLFSLTADQRGRVLGAFERLVQAAPVARIVQFTYVPWLPGPRARTLLGPRVRAVWRNVPPAWVWSATHEFAT